jgi:hypothetical protein
MNALPPGSRIGAQLTPLKRFGQPARTPATSLLYSFSASLLFTFLVLIFIDFQL